MKKREFDKLVDSVINEKLGPISAGILSTILLAGLPLTMQSQPAPANAIIKSEIGNKQVKYLAARKLIIKHEGVRDKVYDDTKGIPTIGIGFNLNRKDAPQLLKAVGADYNSIIKGGSLTYEQIGKLFNYNVAEAIDVAERLIPNFHKQPEFMKTVLIDMAFNLGQGKLSEFRQFLNAVRVGDYKKAAEEMIDSTWYDQVGNRSKRLVQMVKSERILESIKRWFPSIIDNEELIA